MLAVSSLLYAALVRNVSRIRNLLMPLTAGRSKEKLQVLHQHPCILTDAGDAQTKQDDAQINCPKLLQKNPRSISTFYRVKTYIP